MSDKYKIHDIDKTCFVTLTVVDWIDVFKRSNHKLLLVDSLKYCQQKKGLVIFGCCLKPSASDSQGRRTSYIVRYHAGFQEIHYQIHCKTDRR